MSINVRTEQTELRREVEYYEFRKDLYFYDLISSFSISLCGCPAIFDGVAENLLNEKISINFPGVYCNQKKMSPHSLRIMAEKGYINKSKHIASCCMMLANTAYESVKHYNDHSEIFEFFRHIRNASSHLNEFHFNHKEPAHRTRWRNVSIDNHIKGDSHPLNGKPCFGYFMGVADIIELLMDIELLIIAKQHSNESRLAKVC